MLYDAKGDRGYWLSIQPYFGNEQAFAKMRGKTITVPIRTSNVMNANAMRNFAREKAAIFAPKGEAT